MKRNKLHKRSLRLILWTVLAASLFLGIFLASSGAHLRRLLLKKDNPVEEFPKIQNLGYSCADQVFRFLAVNPDSIPTFIVQHKGPPAKDEDPAFDSEGFDEAFAPDSGATGPFESEDKVEESTEELEKLAPQEIDLEAYPEVTSKTSDPEHEEAPASLEEQTVQNDSPPIPQNYVLTDLSHEYLDSVASEYKPLYFEVYILTLESEHDRQGYYPDSRLHYPPPANAVLVYGSPDLFEIPPTAKAISGFCNSTYLINDIGQRSYGIFNYERELKAGQSYDQQVLFYYTVEEGAIGRQATYIDTAIRDYHNFLKLTPDYWKVGIFALFFLLIALVILIVLYYYYSTYTMETKSKLHMDIWSLLWLILFSLVASIIVWPSIAYTGFSFLLQNLAFSFQLFLLLYLFFLLVAGYIRQLKEGVLKENLASVKAIQFLKQRSREMSRLVKVWPKNIYRANRKSFLFVLLLLFTLLFLPPRYAWIGLLILGYLLLELFLELGRIIDQAQHNQPIQEEGKRRFFTFLSPLIEALNQKEKAGQKLLEDKLKSERMRTELITNVSHDIKTPLTSILSYSDLLQQHLKQQGYEDPTGLQYLHTIQRQAERLKRLSIDLVESSKLHSGTVELELGPVSVAEVIPQALAEYETAFKDLHFDLIVEYMTHREVLANGAALWRVLNNLLLNIQKYGRPETRVYIDVREKNDKVYVRLRNISKRALNLPSSELLERFIQGERARNDEGSGLGLSIADSLMQLMQGKLRLDVVADLFTAELELQALPLKTHGPQDEVSRTKVDNKSSGIHQGGD